MVACFLQGELPSEGFGAAIRDALVGLGQSEQLVTHPDLGDTRANHTRRAVLAATRGYGENRELFEDFPSRVQWVRAVLAPDELMRCRYMDYSYWIKLSGGSRLPADAGRRIRAGIRAYGVSNQWFLDASRAIAEGAQFPPLILVGQRRNELVCLEGHSRLTAHALAGFPTEAECLIGTTPTMGRWTH